MNTLKFAAALTLAVSMVTAGCASPQSRIEKNPELFEKLPVEQQALIRAGRIGVGFDEAAVKLALGDPDRITERTSTEGKSTVWRYTVTESYAPFYSGFYGSGFYGPAFFGRAGFYSGFYGSGFYGPPFGGFYPGFGAGIQTSERDRLRVVFVDGKVSAIEEEVR